MLTRLENLSGHLALKQSILILCSIDHSHLLPKDSRSAGIISKATNTLRDIKHPPRQVAGTQAHSQSIDVNRKLLRGWDNASCLKYFTVENPNPIELNKSWINRFRCAKRQFDNYIVYKTPHTQCRHMSGGIPTENTRNNCVACAQQVKASIQNKHRILFDWIINYTIIKYQLLKSVGMVRFARNSEGPHANHNSFHYSYD